VKVNGILIEGASRILGENLRLASLSNAERSGACIEGCGLAWFRCKSRTFRYASAMLRLLKMLSPKISDTPLIEKCELREGCNFDQETSNLILEWRESGKNV